MAEHNIMREYGNGYFGAKDKVTREQLAAFLYRSIPVSSRPLQVN
ncbi:S-layer homology domain-containing protein [Bacillus pseudomycoides]|nr:S-layer homology domain-containing protein [Bacillus pseudomycoides]